MNLDDGGEYTYEETAAIASCVERGIQEAYPVIMGDRNAAPVLESWVLMVAWRDLSEDARESTTTYTLHCPAGLGQHVMDGLLTRARLLSEAAL